MLYCVRLNDRRDSIANHTYRFSKRVFNIKYVDLNTKAILNL